MRKTHPGQFKRQLGEEYAIEFTLNIAVSTFQDFLHNQDVATVLLPVQGPRRFFGN